MIDRRFRSIKWRSETFFAAAKHVMLDLRLMSEMGREAGVPPEYL